MTRMDAQQLDSKKLARPDQRRKVALRIVLVSTPRSGNNWLRHLLATLYDVPSLSVHNPADLDWKALPPECIVGIHWHPLPPFLSLLERHGFRAVALARHPLDVLVSILHFALHAPTARWLEGEGGDERSIYGAMPRSAAFLDYAAGARAAALLSISREWWTVFGCLRARYEELVAGPHTALERLVDNLGVTPRCTSEAALAATTLGKLRQRTGCPQHFWQGNPGLWRSLLPVPEAAGIADAQPASFAALAYACDPDSMLEGGKADAKWIQLVGADLADDMQNLPGLKQQLEASQQQGQALQTQLSASQQAYTELEARFAVAEQAHRAAASQWERERAHRMQLESLGPLSLAIAHQLGRLARRYPRTAHLVKQLFPRHLKLFSTELVRGQPR
jgi:hypothetical protein